MRSLLRIALPSAALLSLLAGTAAAVSTTIVISEFRTRGPNGAADEFVELFNRSASSVNIGGWTLRGSNNAAVTSIRATVPAGTVMPSGCHYLFTNNSASGGPYSGAVSGNLTFATGITDDGGVAIVDGAAVIIDQVGMSAGSAYKEGTILPQLTTSVDRGYERLPGGASGGGTDTDDNLANFQLITPSQPENAASSCVQATPNVSGTWGRIKTIYR
jgi:hypothetical protein